ncbi:hypothetical protein KR084_009920 [Drosophila pseudotakahashii]|nr:hypothetical protein KR084_009920 [Drosophila pseudotakahashii]
MTTTVVRLAAEVAAGKQLPSSLTIKTNRRYGGQVQQQQHPYAVTANSNTISNRPVRIRSVATSVIVAPIACTSTTTPTQMEEEELEELEEEEAVEEMELEMEAELEAAEDQEDQEALEDQEEAQVAAANGLLAWSRAAASQQQQQAQAVLMQG